MLEGGEQLPDKTRAKELLRDVKRITTANSNTIRAVEHYSLTTAIATCSVPAPFHQPIDSRASRLSLSYRTALPTGRRGLTGENPSLPREWGQSGATGSPG